ncbi:MAG: AMP-binding protein [Agromyces sp.]
MPDTRERDALRAQLRRVRAGEPLIITTSGSTDRPKRVALDWAALVAAAEASAKRIGSGNWLLAVPSAYIAGAMVVVRAELAGGTVVALGEQSFEDATAQLEAPKYVSLVPVQLAELLRSPQSAAALATFEAVLVGGQRVPSALRAAAAAAGVRLFVTYGSSETSGGCVYDGIPLPGVQLRVDAEDRLWIAGPMLATGYLTETGELDVERTAASFIERDGVRWYRTDDRAVLHEEPSGVRLEVLGRMDDVIISGGLKLDLAEVQRALDELLGADAAIALAVDGTKWGQSLGVWRIADAPNGTSRVSDESLREMLIARFGRAGTPTMTTGSIPRLANGKPNRRQMSATLATLVTDAGPLDTMVGDE